MVWCSVLFLRSIAHRENIRLVTRALPFGYISFSGLVFLHLWCTYLAEKAREIEVERERVRKTKRDRKESGLEGERLPSDHQERSVILNARERRGRWVVCGAWLFAGGAVVRYSQKRRKGKRKRKEKQKKRTYDRQREREREWRKIVRSLRRRYTHARFEFIIKALFLSYQTLSIVFSPNHLHSPSEKPPTKITSKDAELWITRQIK